MSEPNVLIVEDEVIVAKSMQADLKALGYNNIRTAFSAKEAVTICDKTTPDIVLMDIDLGEEMDGIKAAEVIKSQFAIPIIYLTAHTSPEIVQRAKLTRPHGYIIKPVNEKNLQINIEIALHNAETEAKLQKSEEQKKTMEEELLKTRALEATGTLASGIAHDFNNLLAGILGNLELAADIITPDNKASKLLKEAIKISLKASELTRRFFTFSSGEAPVLESSSVVELINGVVCLGLSGSNVRCECSLPDSLWEIKADREQLCQVIHNVVENAKEAMPKGGILKISAADFEVKKDGENKNMPLEKGRYILMTLSDNGCGIPKKNILKIFDPYFSTKQRGTQKGMGLGLSIAYSIIKKHGGRIHVESGEGTGTTVAIYLPASIKKNIRPEEKTAPEQKQAPPPCLDTRKILIMDDEEILREVTSLMLTQIGCETVVASHGKEALQKYEQARAAGHPFDAVILDLTIKGEKGGIDTIKKLRKTDPEAIAIVASGYSDAPVMSECKKYGFNAAIAKPFSIAQLKDIIDRVVVPCKKKGRIFSQSAPDDYR